MIAHFVLQACEQIFTINSYFSRLFHFENVHSCNFKELMNEYAMSVMQQVYGTKYTRMPVNYSIFSLTIYIIF